MLRRGYNFTDGNDSLGRLDAGLFFVAFVRDPRTGFIPIQDALARTDAPERVPAAHGLRACSRSRPACPRSAPTARS